MAANFSLVSAFTTTVYAGNPAAIVFLEPQVSLDVLEKIARNFNQPVTAVVSPISDASDNDGTIVRRIRFVLPGGKEIPICGHGTLAAAKVLFTQLAHGQENVNTIHFRCFLGGTLKAIKREGGFIELDFPSGVPVIVSNEEEARLSPFINKAFGREVIIHGIRRGGPGVYHRYLIVEVDEKEDLAGSITDPKALIDTDYDINIITSSTTNTNDLFVSRVFSPMIVGGEDPVCGTAHCLLAPYWCEKQGVAPGQEISAVQVSARGGNLRIVWDDVKGTVKLRGQATIFAAGKLEMSSF